jgi:hypothetical protein
MSKDKAVENVKNDRANLMELPSAAPGSIEKQASGSPGRLFS